MSYPKMLRVRQRFERPRVEDVAGTVRSALEQLDLGRTIRPGQSVALTVGSRGIANLPQVVKAVVHFLKDLGAAPFVVPAMGSHGGGTAEGQRQVIESYGVTQAAIGAPIRSSMEVVSLGSTAEGFPVVLDQHAAAADHIGVLARIKPHTGFNGPIESGLLKMMMIGLGKHAGARTCHQVLLDFPFDQVVRSVSRTIRARAPIAFGLGLVENGYEDTAHIEAVQPKDFEPREEAMLVLAKNWLARLPFSQAELLIVDEIGKDISGSGMDTNVVGRKRAFRTQSIENQPMMRHIFVRGLSARTHGNATGIGLSDFTTTRLLKSMDYQATIINCLTSGYPEGAFLPVHFDRDREVLDAALNIIGTRPKGEARVMRILNTMCLEEMDVSEACLADPAVNEITVLGASSAITPDGEGNLAPQAAPTPSGHS